MAFDLCEKLYSGQYLQTELEQQRKLDDSTPGDTAMDLFRWASWTLSIRELDQHHQEN